MTIAVAVIFPGDLLQHPATPVQKATKTAKKDKMKRAIIDRPISAKGKFLLNYFTSNKTPIGFAFRTISMTKIF